MIDQLSTGLPQVAQSVTTGTRDRQQASAEGDDQAGSFEDIVSKAGQRQERQGKGKNAGIDLTGRSALDEQSIATARPKAALELSAALRGLANPSQSQTQAQAQARASSKDAAKTADQAEAALAKLVEKLKTAAQQADRLSERTQQAADDAQAESAEALTPSDELGLLLGLSTTKETDGKHARKSADDKVEAGKDDGDDPRTDNATAKSDLHHADALMAAAGARQRDQAPASDDKSSQNDVVRVVSANGRGRAVDIDVTAVPGTQQQQDGGKSSAPTKIDTATVLEARRYLGFTPEPNATALATAIKADPTWTEALHAAQGSDLGTLGNTVTEVNTLKLQMNPENLGNMVASLKLKGEELTVELRVDSVEAYHHLSADHDDIVKALQDQGFSIDKVTVQLNATDRTDTGADRDMARQGQTGRDGQAQQREGQGGQSGRNDGRQDGQQRWTPGEPRDNASGDGRTEPGRPGNIYL